MYTYAYMYIHICMYVYIYIHIYMYYVYIYIFVLHICIYTYVYIYIHMYMYIHTSRTYSDPARGLDSGPLLPRSREAPAAGQPFSWRESPPSCPEPLDVAA